MSTKCPYCKRPSYAVCLPCGKHHPVTGTSAEGKPYVLPPPLLELEPYEMCERCLGGIGARLALGAVT